MKKYWLMKSEPNAYSIDDLENDGKTPWDGIRNYQARNIMRDDMNVGDEVLFYHSNAKPPGVIGLAKVCKESYPDHTARDKKSKYFDPKATEENPIWCMVDVEFKKKFKQIVSLDELKNHEELDGLMVIKRGQRLSIQPVDPEHFKFIKSLGSKKK